MKDTSQDIYDLQLSLWLKKTPMQRLHQFMKDNDALYKFWNNAKATLTNNKTILTKEIIQLNKTN